MTILQAPSKKLFEDLACLSCCTPLLDPFGQKYCLHCGGSVLVHQCACGRPVPHKPDGTLYNHCSSCGKSTKDVVEKRPKIRLVYNEGQDYKLTCPCLSREPLQEKRPDLNSQLFRQIGASTKKRKKATRPPDTDAEIADRLFGTGSMDFDHDESLNSDDTELAYTGDVLQLIPEKQPKLVSGVRIQPSNNSPSTKTSDGRDKPIPPGRQRQAGQVGGGKYGVVFSEKATKYLIHRTIELLEARDRKIEAGEAEYPTVGELFNKVAIELQNFDCWVTGKQCSKKFHKMRYRFNDILSANVPTKTDIFNYKDDFCEAYAKYRPNKSALMPFKTGRKGYNHQKEESLEKMVAEAAARNYKSEVKDDCLKIFLVTGSKQDNIGVSKQEATIVTDTKNVDGMIMSEDA